MTVWWEYWLTQDCVVEYWIDPGMGGGSANVS